MFEFDEITTNRDNYSSFSNETWFNFIKKIQPMPWVKSQTQYLPLTAQCGQDTLQDPTTVWITRQGKIGRQITNDILKITSPHPLKPLL